MTLCIHILPLKYVLLIDILFVFRLGLVQARLAGARLALGDVLIFLHPHCEGVEGWVEPLLKRIKESRTSVLVPIMDIIDEKGMHYNTKGYKHFQVRPYWDHKQ